MDTFLQRYPSSPIYLNSPSFNFATSRWLIWKWMGTVILSLCLFTPLLGLMTESVRERQYRMKDILEISGMMSASYWASYLVTALIIGQITM